MKATVLTFAALSLFVGAPVSAQRADSLRYVVSVDGLACPFCAFGLERKLGDLPGVDEVAISLAEGKASFAVSEGAVVLPSAIRDAVLDAGFTTRQIELTVVGRVVVSGQILTVAIGGRRPLRLAGGEHLSQVRTLLDGGATRFRLRGIVTRRGQHELLRVERVERVEHVEHT